MSTYRELVYLTLDELKLSSDDSQYTEDHIIFLLSKYRAFLLKQRYSDIKKQMPESNYQTICLDLMEVPAICGEECEGGTYLRSISKVPYLMLSGIPRVYPVDYYKGNISFVSRDRMRYVGFNKYLGNIIYCSIAPDSHLYFKSLNPQFLYLQRVKFTGIFQDCIQASDMECSEGETPICNVIDKVFPIEDALIPPLIELVVKELTGALYRPDDDINNAKDDLSGATTGA